MTPDPTPPTPTPPASAPTRRRWPRRVLGFVVIVAVLVWFAPVIVAKTALRNRVIAAATADIRGTVTVGSVSAGWLSAIELRDVTVADREGRTVLTVPRVVTSKTLLGFLRDRSDLGEIEIPGASADVVCDAGSTNLEDVLAEYLKDDGRPPAVTRPAIRVRIADGSLKLHDSATGKASAFTGIGVTAAVPADRAAPIALTLAASAGTGTVEAKAEVGAGGSADIKAIAFPLDALAPALTRLQLALMLAGTATADVKGTWQSATAVTLEGTAGVRDLDVSGPLLKGDRVVIPVADLPLKAELANGTARVRVTGGRVILSDGPGRPPVDVAALTADVAVPMDGKGAIVGSVSLATAGPTPGKLDAEARIADVGNVKLRATNFPLAALAPALRRLEPAASLAGTLTADLSAGWEENGKTARVEGTAGVRDLDVAGPWLKGDRLRLAAADLPIKAELKGKAVRVEKATLTCDVGRLSAVGAFDSSNPPERILDQPGVSLEANIDLAKLAGLLPNLLRVREGTAVREGNVVVALASRAGKDGTAWDGTVRTSALKAVRDGKPIEWPEPLAVEFSARAASGQLPTFDKLLCKSDFVALNAQGSAESVRAAANIYLDRLTARAGEFVDLGGLALSGEATAWLVGTRTPAGAFKTDAGAELKNFAFAKPGYAGLSEKQLTLKASVNGAWITDGPIRIDGAYVEVNAGADHFEARTAGVIADVRAVSEGRVAVRLVGDLGRWAGRARGFVGIPREYQFGGSINAAGTFALEPLNVSGDGLVVAVTNAKFLGFGMDLNEPLLQANGSLTMNRKSGDVVLAPVTIVSPTLVARDARFTFEFPEKAPMVITGAGGATGDLNGLARTFHMQSAADGPGSFHGRGVGPVRFRWQGDTTTFGGTLDVTGFAYGPSAKPTLTEPRFRFDLDAKYDQTPGLLTVLTTRVERPGMAVEGKGTWGKFDTTQDVDVTGTLTYDLAAVTPEVRAAVGGGFQAAGKGSRPFALRGSLNPPPGSANALAASGALGWDAVRAFGFEMGPGEFNARVSNGVGTISPITATFGGGRVSVAPTLKLGPGVAEASVSKGRVIDKAKLTPAVCAGAVGYALPVVANAAQAEGEVSFDVDDNRVPLADFTGATVRGKLIVHKAAVSAGPIVTELVQLLGEPAPRVVLANDMTVPIRVENGRVHHENLMLTVNGYTLKTNGSVGFDGSVAVVADVPIPGTFPGLKNNPALKKALEGKVVKVPIGGTMAKPAIDRGGFNAAVAAAAREGVTGAAKDVGRDVLNRELERLFPGAMPGGGTPAPPGGRPPLFPLPQGLPIPKK